MKTTKPPVGTNAVTWAQEHGVPYRYRTVLDNHTPPRKEVCGDMWSYRLRTNDGDGFILKWEVGVKKHLAFVIDDGVSTSVFYVAGWGKDNDYLILHPFPLNVNEDGTPKLRADNGRPVNMNSWVLGPSTMYHLKVSRIEPDTAEGAGNRVRIPSAPIYVTHEHKAKVGWVETIYPMGSEVGAEKKYRELRLAYPRDRVAIMRRKPRPGWKTITTIAPS